MLQLPKIISQPHSTTSQFCEQHEDVLRQRAHLTQSPPVFLNARSPHLQPLEQAILVLAFLPHQYTQQIRILQHCGSFLQIKATRLNHRPISLRLHNRRNIRLHLLPQLRLSEEKVELLVGNRPNRRRHQDHLRPLIKQIAVRLR